MDNRTKFKFNDLDVSSVLLLCCKKSYSTSILSTSFKNTCFNAGMTKAHYMATDLLQLDVNIVEANLINTKKYHSCGT